MVVEDEPHGVYQGQATAQAALVIRNRNVEGEEYVGDVFGSLENFMHRTGVSTLDAEFSDKAAQVGVGEKHDGQCSGLGLRADDYYVV